LSSTKATFSRPAAGNLLDATWRLKAGATALATLARSAREARHVVTTSANPGDSIFTLTDGTVDITFVATDFSGSWRRSHTGRQSVDLVSHLSCESSSLARNWY
jgi:hypothetical protein